MSAERSDVTDEDLGAAVGPGRRADDPLAAIDWGVEFDHSTISVYFAEKGEKIEGIRTTDPWTPYERGQVFEALGTYSDVSLLTFVETDSLDEADFVLTQNGRDLGLGFFFPPDPDDEFPSGFGWFRNVMPDWSGPARGVLEPGGYGFLTIVHETGHGLGLAHPHDDAGGSTILPHPDGLPGLDQTVYTVMSYNDGWPAGPTGTSPAYDFGFNLTPAALDIAVIQSKYGANMDTHAGDDVYLLPVANERGTGFTTIWDAGGHDTIVADTRLGVMIDLRAATLVGLTEESGAGGYVSYADGIYGGITIAAGVVIEDAASGAGKDILVGNDADNALFGGRGRDVLIGEAGDDTLDGGRGADTMFGGLGDDVYIVDAPRDRVVEAADEGNDLVVSATIDLDLGDYQHVEAAMLTGRAALSARGDDGDDRLVGNAGRNRLFGEAGNDSIEGGGGKDVLRGGVGNDLLFGEGGGDVLRGGAGRDNLRGGAGNDTMFGGAGADRFIIGPADGHDTIGDFRAGVDVVKLAGLALTTFEAVADAMSDTADGVLITFDPDASLLFSNLAAADLSAGDFMF